MMKPAFSISYPVPDDKTLVSSALLCYIESLEKKKADIQSRYRVEEDNLVRSALSIVGRQYDQMLAALWEIKAQVESSSYVDLRKETELVENLQKTQKELEGGWQ